MNQRDELQHNKCNKKLNHVSRKAVFWVSEQVRQTPCGTASGDGKRLEISN